MPLTLLWRFDRSTTALRIVVDPRADRGAQAELGGDARHEFDAGGRRIGTDRLGHRREDIEIVADLLRLSLAAVFRVHIALERRVGNAGELAREIGSFDLLPAKQPQAGMHARHEGDDSSDGAHRLYNQVGLDDRPTNSSPKFGRDLSCCTAAYRSFRRVFK